VAEIQVSRQIRGGPHVTTAGLVILLAKDQKHSPDSRRCTVYLTGILSNTSCALIDVNVEVEVGVESRIRVVVVGADGLSAAPRRRLLHPALVRLSVAPQRRLLCHAHVG